MNFDGTAIYVFLILANTSYLGITNGETNCVFKLDGATIGSFRHKPSATTDSQFDVLALSKTDIPFGNHELVIATENLQNNAYLNFDYAIYTHDDNKTSTSTSSASASSHTSTATSTSRSKKGPNDAIAGGSVGGVICLAIGVNLFFCYRRRRTIKHAVLLDDDDDDTSSTPMTRHRRVGTWLFPLCRFLAFGSI